MERYEDIQELFDTLDRNLVELSASYDSARFNEEQATALRPLVKSIVSDLRSVLDYSAHTIYEAYSTKHFVGYFPFGEDEAGFVKAVKCNLNGLQVQRPDLYALVESIQPHKAANPWLHTLCKIAALTKHRELGKQRRVNSGSVRTEIGCFVTSEGGSIILNGVKYNGTVIGGGKPVVISENRSLKEIESDFNMPIKGVREYGKVAFYLDGFDVDALELLSTARQRIGVFVESLKLAVGG
ncbi:MULTISPECIES: hypothetical protein [Pseudomonas]|uniref:hypothetical protein n=1 Tax=Pseudomonas TaxID=286 RepID=UPI001648F0C1|nr:MULTISPECIES: hypothetical protein [Pseudomonas]MBK3454962.1 hypothetical protein [Pseudomonas sp. MF6754]QXH91070.1 hypothetical protein HU773_009430 [Pseudomonas shahriarae]